MTAMALHARKSARLRLTDLFAGLRFCQFGAPVGTVHH